MGLPGLSMRYNTGQRGRRVCGGEKRETDQKAKRWPLTSALGRLPNLTPPSRSLRARPPSAWRSSISSPPPRGSKARMTLGNVARFVSRPRTCLIASASAEFQEDEGRVSKGEEREQKEDVAGRTSQVDLDDVWVLAGADRLEICLCLLRVGAVGLGAKVGRGGCQPLFNDASSSQG